MNIVICTFINKEKEYESDWYDRSQKTIDPLYVYINDFFKNILQDTKFKLWLVVSPIVRKARHDRFIVTNYQHIECGAGFTYFDDQGKFINRGDAIHLCSIIHDDYRKTVFPDIINKIQSIVIDKVLETNPERIFGKKNGNSYYLNFT